MNTLVVANNIEFTRPLTHSLERNGHTVHNVATGAAALNEHHTADLVLLDLDLPDIDGLHICRQIRDRGRTPLIAFTPGGAGLDRVLGLQAGADDCVDKPYQFRELLARIEAVMRRSQPDQQTRTEVVSVGGLQLNTSSRAVQVHNDLVELTRKEFDLLHYLASQPETVLTREQLMTHVWGDDTVHALSSRTSRTIDTHISSLRNKLGDSGWIVTIRGIGFRLGHSRVPATT